MTVGTVVDGGADCGGFELLFWSLRPQGSLSVMAASVIARLSLSLAVNTVPSDLGHRHPAKVTCGFVCLAMARPEAAQNNTGS